LGLLRVDDNIQYGLIKRSNNFSLLLIETVNPHSQGTSGDQQCLADKISVGTGQQHLDGAASCSCLSGSHPANLHEIFDGRVFPMGDE
jgi:hypothetical protein